MSNKLQMWVSFTFIKIDTSLWKNFAWFIVLQSAWPGPITGYCCAVAGVGAHHYNNTVVDDVLPVCTGGVTPLTLL